MPEPVISVVVPVLDEEQSIAPLVEGVRDPAQAARMGELGRARVMRDFSWAQATERIQAILVSVTRRPARR